MAELSLGVRPPESWLLAVLAGQGVTLSPEQMVPYLCNSRLIQVIGGWRAGKSFVTALWQYARLGYGPLHWLVGPDYAQTKAEFDYLVKLATTAGVLHSSTNSKRDSNHIELKMLYPLEANLDKRIPHERIQLLTRSAAYPEKLAGTAPTTIAMVEAGQQTAEVRDTLIGRTSEKRGPLFMSGTLEKDVGWYADFHDDNLAGAGDQFKPGAVVLNLPSYGNRHVYPLGEDDPEIAHQRQMLGEELFKEKFLGIPQRPRHRVFQGFYEPLRNRAIPSWGAGIDPNRPVYLAIDPGHAHRHAVLAIQMDGKTAWVVDSLWVRHYTAQGVIDLLKQRVWWGQIAYYVIDVAGRQKGADGKSYLDIYRMNLPGVPYGTTKVPLEAGYNRHKTCLLADWGDPKVMILDRQDAYGPLEWEYNHHRWKLDAHGEPIREQPEEINDDAIKALTYFLWDRFGATGQTYEGPPVTVRLEYAGAA